MRPGWGKERPGGDPRLDCGSPTVNKHHCDWWLTLRR